MSNRINDLAYNRKLLILSIHFNLSIFLKTLVKSMGYKLSPINIISGHRFFGMCLAYFRFAINALGNGFAKLSTSVGMGTCKSLQINPPRMELING